MTECKSLLKDISYQVIKGSDDRSVSSVVYNSDQVEKDCMFICIVGAKFDAHEKAAEAAEKGAAVLVVSHEVKLPEDASVTVIKVEDTRYAMAFISAAYFGNPADKLKVIGITGTKGKTTTTYLVKYRHRILRRNPIYCKNPFRKCWMQAVIWQSWRFPPRD